MTFGAEKLDKSTEKAILEQREETKEHNRSLWRNKQHYLYDSSKERIFAHDVKKQVFIYIETCYFTNLLISNWEKAVNAARAYF
jgi:hypothetical protein